MAILIYIIAVNIAAYLLFGYDKYCAKRDRWRVPEATLLFISLAGGSAGAYLAMKRFHHKTKKAVFSFGVPFLFVLQSIFAVIFILYG